MKNFSKTVILLSTVFVLTFGAGFAKAENSPSSTLADLVSAIQEQIYNLKVQLLKLQIDDLQKQFLAVASGVTNPAPTVTNISPSSATAGGPGFTMTVNGTGFVSGVSIVYLGPGAPFVYGTNKTTTYISSTQLTAAIPALDLTTAETFSVVVFNNGAISNAQTFTVNAANNPAPTITSISPNSATAGSAGFTLIVNGENFITGPADQKSVISWDGINQTTTYVTNTRLTGIISSSDLTTAGTHTIRVFNPTPGGGTSGAQTFTINAATNPTPTITSIDPSEVIRGTSQLNVNVYGTGFNQNSVVRFNNQDKPTVLIQGLLSNYLRATLSASDLSVPGSYFVKVFNSDGGGYSNFVYFDVRDFTPSITNISPTSALVGSSSITLTVTGSGFSSNSKIIADFNPLITTYILPNQLTATLPALKFNMEKVIPINVGNYSESSDIEYFVVVDPIKPRINSLAPAEKDVGSGSFILNITGSNFLPNSTVSFGGNLKTKTYISPMQLRAAITASDVATLGTFNVWVTNWGSGINILGTSNIVPLEVVAPTPVITNIVPTSAVSGNQFIITVNGSNFLPSSEVVLGFSRPTTYISPTQLTAVITAYVSVGQNNVTVKNPGILNYSDAQIFTVLSTTSTPLPIITNILPTSAPVGSGQVVLTVNGSSFKNNSKVQTYDDRGNLLDFVTTFISTAQLTAVIPSSNLASAQIYEISVLNPPINDYGNFEVSNKVEFTVSSSNNVSNRTPSGISTPTAGIPVTNIPTTNASAVAFGQRSDGAKNLQTFLNTHGFIIATTGGGSPGNETNYFGLRTRNALQNFQEANGLPRTSRASGTLGPWTRAIILEKYDVSL